MLTKSLTLLLVSFVILGQTVSPATQRQADEYARRDLKLERDALAQRQKLDAMLPPWAKRRLELAFKAFLKRLLSEGRSADLSNIVREELGRQFKNLTPQQSNILTLHVLTGVVKMLPPHARKVDAEAEKERLRDNKDSISEMGETDMLMLQQLMEKKGQLESMISNTMKAGSEGGQAAIQALKAS
jgi:hypothetical protein